MFPILKDQIVSIVSNEIGSGSTQIIPIGIDIAIVDIPSRSRLKRDHIGVKERHLFVLATHPQHITLVVLIQTGRATSLADCTQPYCDVFEVVHVYVIHMIVRNAQFEPLVRKRSGKIGLVFVVRWTYLIL
jgi:hypothetical protein